MATFNPPLPHMPPLYEQPKLKSLPLPEQPAYRVTQNASACNLTELLAAVIGGQRQIETSLALLERFDGDIRRLYQAHPAELIAVIGISQATAARIKAALNLGLRLNLPNEERPMINSPADAAALVQYEMGLLEKEHLRVIHNLETAPSNFDTICTTHSYAQRLKTVEAVKGAGLLLCSGGIFGMGESPAQRAEFALRLKRLEVDRIPVNFLNPISGTAMEHRRRLTPLEALHIVAALRITLPEQELIVCGGREVTLGSLQPLLFSAGANGIMTGRYLTTPGQGVEAHPRMLADLELDFRHRDPETSQRNRSPTAGTRRRASPSATRPASPCRCCRPCR